MKSATLPSFWEKYHTMSPAVRTGAKKAYQLWAENPFHPSLHFIALFKCMGYKVFVESRAPRGSQQKLQFF